MNTLMALRLSSFSSGVPPTPAHSSISFSATKFFLPVKFSRRRFTFPRIYAFSSNDIKVGSNIEVDGSPWKVIGGIFQRWASGGLKPDVRKRAATEDCCIGAQKGSMFWARATRQDDDFAALFEFLHVKPGKGAAYVRTTLRNHITGNSVEKTFRAGSKIEQAEISKETKQFTYKEGPQFVFMDLTSYEEIRLNESDMGDKTKWLKEGMDCNLLFWKGKVIDFELPLQVKMKIVDVDPGTKGDAAQGGSKPATLETGAVVYVPLFVDRDQEIIVDTRTGQYVSRV